MGSVISPPLYNIKVALVADISLFVAKITFVMAEMIIREHVITSSVAKFTYVMAKITLKVVVVTSSVAKITFVVDETTFKEAVTTFSVAKIIFEVAEITFKVASVADINLLVAKIILVEIIIKDDVITPK